MRRRSLKIPSFFFSIFFPSSWWERLKTFCHTSWSYLGLIQVSEVWTPRQILHSFFTHHLTFHVGHMRYDDWFNTINIIFLSFLINEARDRLKKICWSYRFSTLGQSATENYHYFLDFCSWKPVFTRLKKPITFWQKKQRLLPWLDTYRWTMYTASIKAESLVTLITFVQPISTKSHRKSFFLQKCRLKADSYCSLRARGSMFFTRKTQKKQCISL